jgi:hypothetical protein
MYKEYPPYLLSFTLSTFSLLLVSTSFFKVYIDYSGKFCTGISHMYISYVYQINLLYCLLFLYFPLYYPYYSTVVSAFGYTIFIRRCVVFQYYSLSTILISPLLQSCSLLLEIFVSFLTFFSFTQHLK